MSSQIVYVLSLKTWSDEWDPRTGRMRSHHWYGRIHWDAPEPCDCNAGIIYKGFDVERCTACGIDMSKSGQQSSDALALPREGDGYCDIRHDTRESVVAGARRWFAEHALPGSCLVIGVWTLLGWDAEAPFEVLEGTLISD